ncbi:hypothetical protein M409DRAFT_65132 [Zasmidium cellare ATCC 36951]|uniref:Alanyl-transfer RNA synthetases family profile domain-containing protein n=1 Tax=Zasmidium cellare ATCC 36951 TaxID=1080233 RepID=A0A6A6CTL4_ZASCE|nr:uncharacterized protein M409DRAFT_65132 [Zasmidium cellare ATCC 36951]KAF2169500.1 hypothetical protein M409DRAFT_65132 [Zasmidium cellare ATCC 36951]
MADNTVPTYMAFQHDGHLLHLETKMLSVQAAQQLGEDNQKVFKQYFTDEDFVVITKDTIFHPQGGGQPTDEGTMTSISNSDAKFQVTSVRMDASNNGQALHLGRFVGPASAQFQPNEAVGQDVDGEKRLLYSRLHTAGHVLGAAVRHLLEHQVENFDELKASHFPDSAACEFQGLIEGKHKAAIQERLDEYVSRGVPVEVDFWSEDDFRREGLARLIPDRSLLPPGEDKFRVVKIVGLETYPCGGTHVDDSSQCGEVAVKKISRSKGNSRVSYSVK